MKNIEILKNKIVLIFGILFFLSIFMLIYVLSLKNDITQAKEKLNSYSLEFSILEENKKLGEKWRLIESELDILREKRDEILRNIELLDKNKAEIETQIQENRQKFFAKNENVK